MFYCYIVYFVAFGCDGGGDYNLCRHLALRHMIRGDSIMMILVKCLIFTVLMFAVVGIAAHALGLDKEDS